MSFKHQYVCLYTWVPTLNSSSSSINPTSLHSFQTAYRGELDLPCLIFDLTGQTIRRHTVIPLFSFSLTLMLCLSTNDSDKWACWNSGVLFQQHLLCLAFTETQHSSPCLWPLILLKTTQHNSQKEVLCQFNTVEIWPAYLSYMETLQRERKRAFFRMHYIVKTPWDTLRSLLLLICCKAENTFLLSIYTFVYINMCLFSWQYITFSIIVKVNDNT